ncbi:MAG: DUF3786 domain-containing protein [Candidatus Omnitrophica bacterium]|nr:DUF3786 domain-containing protein [Candidatus Omnitrophota bacterium]
MGYEVALNKSWEELERANPACAISVRFLADTYSINIQERQVLSLSCNIPAKDFQAILILHYLATQLKGLPVLTGEWLPFRQLSGVEGYREAFRNRSLVPIIRKYGGNAQGLYAALERLPAQNAEGADAAIIIEAFGGVPVLLKVWQKDEEFDADANIFFDRSVTGIFCTEDIVVLAGFVAAAV